MIYRLGPGSILQIHGKDRCKVINNLTTQDLRTLANGQSTESFVTEPKGKVFAHGMVVGLADAVWFITVPGHGERLLKHVDRYIIMEDAKLVDVSSHYNIWLSDDPVGFLGCVVGQGNQSDEENRPSIGRGEAKEWDLNGNRIVAIWAPWVSDDSFLVLVPTDAESSFRETIASLKSKESDFQNRVDWEAQRIDQFWPWYGQDMDDKNLPQELDRDEKAISFTKGCYLGQETIARLDALGQVQKKLVRIAISGTQLPSMEDDQDKILRSSEAEVGQLRSVAMRSNGELVGLAIVKRSHFARGTRLSLGSNRTDATII